MGKIRTIQAREILDSRGEPTLEIDLTTDSTAARASVPSGASVGAYEAHELRDGDPERYRGRGVQKAVSLVNGEIAEAVAGRDFDQRSLDDFLIKFDGTKDKSRLGANSILGVSLAFARAQAQEQKVELYEYLGSLDGRTKFALPQPSFNVLNGGKHAHSGLDIQEFMLVPVAFPTIAEKIRAAAEIIAKLKEALEKKGYETGLGDEGGFAPKLGSNEEALHFLVQAIQSAGYTTEQVKIAIDAAATSFYQNGSYVLSVGGGKKTLDRAGMLLWYQDLVARFPIVSIEDGFAEDDFDGFVALSKAMGNKVMLVGDDLTVTNVGRIELAVKAGAANALLVKPNQVGTVTETLAAIHAARAAGWKCFASHRSGETDDTFIADLAVGFGCEYIKAGSLMREERVGKYNRLMEIETQLQKNI